MPAAAPGPSGAAEAERSGLIVPTREAHGYSYLDHAHEVPVADAGGIRVPALLAGAAAWAWRLIVIAAAFYLFVLLLNRLALLVIPFLAAMLATALLHPVTGWLRRHGVGRGISALIAIVLAFAVLGGIGFLVVNRAIADYPSLAKQSTHVVTQLENTLTSSPFNLSKASIDNIGTTITDYLNKNQSSIATGAISAGRDAIDVLTALVLFIFLTIFLVYDGDRIWAWVVRLVPRRAEARTDIAGQRIWHTLSGYITGQFTVALFHAVTIGVSLFALGSPLVAPLAVVVFVSSFVPIIGAIVAGVFAVVVVLVAGGVVKGVILLAILVVDSQVESHILQPLVVGRYVKLHPIAIAVSLTGGALLGGLPGAIFAVPIVAGLNAAAKYLSGREDEHGNALPGRLGPPVAVASEREPRP